MGLSVVIITYQEESNIQACLESVSFADEIIVLDSGSVDHTVNIARQYTSKVFVVDWPGDGPQRNRGIEMATQEWVLCLDADEQVSPSLAAEIKNIVLNTSYDGFSIPFLSHYLSKPIYFGDWRKERHTRLFKKASGRYSGSDVYGAQGAHCRPIVEGRVGDLKGLILHYPYPTLEKVLQKMNQYSSGSAAIKHASGQKSSLYKALFRGFWAFLRGYILRAGFLDGKEGFILAFSNAEGVYYRYLKLWLYARDNKP